MIVVLFTLMFPIFKLANNEQIHQFATVTPDNKIIELIVNAETMKDDILSVEWYKCESKRTLLTIYRNSENASSMHQKYKADANRTHIRLTIHLGDQEDNGIISIEGTYCAEVTTVTNETSSHTIELTLHVALTVRIDFSSQRRIGHHSTVFCAAKGWKPQPVLKLFVFGELYPKSVYEEEIAVAIFSQNNNEYSVKAIAEFIVQNKHRGAIFQCKAWNEALDADAYVTAQKVFEESYSYSPVAGDSCLWPPNKRSQCEREDIPGMGCSFGECRLLFGENCTEDDDCGHASVSRLQCIENKCICNSDVFFFDWNEPFCKPITHKICNDRSDCTSTNILTECEGNLCICNPAYSSRVTKISRGQLYFGCQTHIGKRCENDDSCTIYNAALACIDSYCGCKEGFLENFGICIDIAEASVEDTQAASQDSSNPEGLTRDEVQVLIIGCVLGTGVAIVAGTVIWRLRTVESLNQTKPHHDTDFFNRKTNIDSLDQKLIKAMNTNAAAFAAQVEALSEGAVARKKKRKKTKFFPKRNPSNLSLKMFSSEGKKNSEGPDFGKSSVDPIEKLAKKKIKQKKVKQTASPDKKNTTRQAAAVVHDEIINQEKKDKLTTKKNKLGEERADPKSK